MSTPDAAGEDPQPELEHEPEPATEDEPQVTRTEQQVELKRSVRYGRILIVAAIFGAIIAALITLMFPIPPNENYTMGQIVGFMLVVGAVAGLALGAILSLILGRVAKRTSGSGVAIQTDVR